MGVQEAAMMLLNEAIKWYGAGNAGVMIQSIKEQDEYVLVIKYREWVKKCFLIPRDLFSDMNEAETKEKVTELFDRIKRSVKVVALRFFQDNVRSDIYMRGSKAGKVIESDYWGRHFEVSNRFKQLLYIEKNGEKEFVSRKDLIRLCFDGKDLEEFFCCDLQQGELHFTYYEEYAPNGFIPTSVVDKAFSGGVAKTFLVHTDGNRILNRIHLPQRDEFPYTFVFLLDSNHCVLVQVPDLSRESVSKATGFMKAVYAATLSDYKTGKFKNPLCGSFILVGKNATAYYEIEEIIQSYA